MDKTMPRDKRTGVSGLTTAELLGRRLNDVEDKYAPDQLYVEGIMKIPLPKPRVSIVGSRKVSDEGQLAATKIATSLAKQGVVIVSGLAEGVDTAAHEAAIAAGGSTIAVLGTPLDKSYPQKNYQLQQYIMKNHLVISQFPIGYPTTPKDFAIRNRTMALISDATIIVEAKEKSGSLHQGWEALRLGHPLFIWKDIWEDMTLNWPLAMSKYGAMHLTDPNEVLEVIPSSHEVPLFS